MIERKDGFLVLDKQVELLEENFGYYCWCLIAGKKYFFKIVNDKLEAYRELFGEEVANYLNIPTVSYDLAMIREGKRKVIGVISKDFNNSTNIVIPLYKILNEYYTEVLKNKNSLEVDNKSINNLENIWDALLYHYRDRDNCNIIVFPLVFSIIDAFILQICLGNADLHDYNLQIFEGNNPSLVPNFDYGKALEVLVRDDINNYKLKVTEEEETAIDTIKMFLKTSSSEYRNYFFNKILMLPDIEEIFRKIEEKTQFQVPRNVKRELSFYYEENLMYLKELIEKENVNIKR